MLVSEGNLRGQKGVPRGDAHACVLGLYVNPALFLIFSHDPYEIRVPFILELWKDDDGITFFEHLNRFEIFDEVLRRLALLSKCRSVYVQ